MPGLFRLSGIYAKKKKKDHVMNTFSAWHGLDSVHFLARHHHNFIFPHGEPAFTKGVGKHRKKSLCDLRATYSVSEKWTTEVAAAAASLNNRQPPRFPSHPTARDCCPL
jgi:hypothetical protein